MRRLALDEMLDRSKRTPEHRSHWNWHLRLVVLMEILAMDFLDVGGHWRRQPKSGSKVAHLRPILKVDQLEERVQFDELTASGQDGALQTGGSLGTAELVSSEGAHLRRGHAMCPENSCEKMVHGRDSLKVD